MTSATSGQTAIVVVDDEEVQRNELAEFVTNYVGVGCATAADGKTAIDMVERLHPKLVLLDINLPDMTGIDVARRIRKQGSEYPKVILMSGHSDLVRDANLESLNVFSVIDKPVPLKVLGDFIWRLLNAEPGAEPGAEAEPEAG